MDITKINTIAILMMENRSFDHMLGYLSHADYGKRPEVDGFSKERIQNEIYYAEGKGYTAFPLRDLQLASDLGHERDAVARQLNLDTQSGDFGMDGFVEDYYFLNKFDRDSKPKAIGFYTADELPITDFFAREFAICDRWFCCLPASTQPNRLMSLSGYTRRDITASTLFQKQTLVFDWLTERDVSWRVYHDGLSFLALCPQLWDDLFTTRFRPFSRLAADLVSEKAFPKVIFIEPTYQDSPVHVSHANDNHAPLDVGYGEQFLRAVYRAFTGSKRWSESALIITYDEHGGFFDHVPPLPLVTASPDGTYESFFTTGLRVPGMVISPFVSPGRLFQGHLDHTSILQFLAERFDSAGDGYSAEVNQRRDSDAKIRSIAEVFDLEVPRVEIPAVPTLDIAVRTTLRDVKQPESTNQEAFEKAAEKLVETRRVEVRKKHPELLHWYEVKKQLEN